LASVGRWSRFFHENDFFPCFFDNNIEFIDIQSDFVADGRNLIVDHWYKNEAPQNGAYAQNDGTSSSDIGRHIFG